MPTVHGRVISRTDAQELLDNQYRIAKENRLLIAADCKKRGDNAASNYYYADAKGKPANCFIFDFDLIKRFTDEGATQLLVFLGAQTREDENVEIGNPTIIVVGCTFEVDGEKEKYTSVLPEIPGIEHPPVTAIPSMPLTGFSFDIL